ncbi:MAG: hypothetical protein ACREKI_05220 [Gemmatimonadota bacterium]
MARPKSKTLSASVPQPVYERAREVVRSENRRQSAVVADALRLYTSLTPAARRVMEELAEEYGAGMPARLESELSRALLRVRWEALAEETRRRLPKELAELSEEELAGVVEEEITGARREGRAGRPKG